MIDVAPAPANLCGPHEPLTPLQQTRNALPREFDAELYRSLNADLSRFSAKELRDHYEHFGRSEGRRSHSLAGRDDFAALLGPGLDVLEIGPLLTPMVKGPRVRYFELFDKPQLIALANARGIGTDRIPDIHYVSATADLSIVNDRFDAVLTSHVVEHQPDFLGHLASIRRLLRPGGLYFSLIPDKRFCFDHFMPPSSVAEFLEAHHARRTRHTLRSQINYAAFRTHNDVVRHWAGDHGAQAPMAHEITTTIAQTMRAEDRGEYQDVHAWYFEPESFGQAMNLLHELGYSEFRPLRLYPTLLNCNEFWAVLQAKE